MIFVPPAGAIAAAVNSRKRRTAQEVIAIANRPIEERAPEVIQAITPMLKLYTAIMKKVEEKAKESPDKNKS